jgi:hypothetical protein
MNGLPPSFSSLGPEDLLKECERYLKISTITISRMKPYTFGQHYLLFQSQEALALAYATMELYMVKKGE